MKSTASPAVVPRIFAIRGESVMLDSDLAILYKVETKQFNRAIQRDAQRFPSDFAFQLTRQEFTNLKYQFGISSSHGGRRKHPWVFTEHGAIMAAMILSSEQEVARSVGSCESRGRGMKMRQELLADATLEARLQKIEKVLLGHDIALRDVIQKLRPLLLPPPDPPRPRIGFR